MDLQPFIEAGLYAPDAPRADERLELIEHLLERGFSAEHIIATWQRLALVTDLGFALAAGRRPRISLAEVALRSQTSVEEVVRFRRALGLPEGDHDVPEIPETFVEDMILYLGSAAQFGAEPTLSFARVVGAAVMTITEAGRELFASPLHAKNAREVEISKANEDAMAAWHALQGLIGRLMLERTGRDLWFEEGILKGETNMAIGFVDLVGSTTWTNSHDPDVVAGALARFETMAVDIAVSTGARVVKFVGDEAMIAAADPTVAASAAVSLSEAIAADDGLPPARGAVVFGPVTPRGGDYFGPVVNLAARAAGVAPPEGVVVTAEVAAHLPAAAWRTTPLPAQSLRGISQAPPLLLLERRPPDPPASEE